MKLATYVTEGAARIGIVHSGDRMILDLRQAAGGGFASMLDLIDAGPAGLDAARRLMEARGDDPAFNVAVGAVRLLSPVPVPRQMRGFTSFPGHLAYAPWGVRTLLARLKGETLPPRTAQAVPAINAERPIYLKTNRFSVIGTETEVRWPGFAEYMDFETECGFFLGSKGVNLTPENAGEMIFGYTVFNDMSARDAQVVEMQGHLGPAKGKDFDTGNVIGPWIVTRDELPDIRSRRMTTYVSGELWTDSSMADGLFSFEEMIAYVSRDETLYPGEFISAGTVTNGSGLERDRYLRDGDLIEMSIDGIGTLRNRLVKPRG